VTETFHKALDRIAVVRQVEQTEKVTKFKPPAEVRVTPLPPLPKSAPQPQLPPKPPTPTVKAAMVAVAAKGVALYKVGTRTLKDLPPTGNFPELKRRG